MTSPHRQALAPLTLVALVMACALPPRSLPRRPEPPRFVRRPTSPRGAPLALASPQGVVASPSGLRARLHRASIGHVTFTAENGRYDEVLKLAQVVTGIGIVITPKARALIRDENLTLETELRAPLSVANLLDLLAAQSGKLGWTLRHGVVIVQAKTEAGKADKLRTYDVRDLTFPRTEFLPPVIAGIPTGETGDTSRQGGEADEKVAAIEGDNLVNQVKLATGPGYWDAEGGGRIEFLESGTLLVTANPRMQRRVAHFLAVLR